MSGFAGVKSDATFYVRIVSYGRSIKVWVVDVAYKICQVDMAFRIKQHVVRLDIAMYNALLMDVPHGTTKFCNPELDGIFSECLSRNVKAKVATIHEIDDQISKQDG